MGCCNMAFSAAPAPCCPLAAMKTPRVAAASAMTAKRTSARSKPASPKASDTMGSERLPAFITRTASSTLLWALLSNRKAKPVTLAITYMIAVRSTPNATIFAMLSNGKSVFAMPNNTSAGLNR